MAPKKKKNPPTPSKDDAPKPKRERRVINKNPYPDAPLNQRSYPQILDNVLSYPESWFALRSTGKAMKERVDALLYKKVVIRAAQFYDLGVEPEYDDDIFDPFHEDLMDPYGDPLVGVVGHHSRLPYFPPRMYMEDEHGRKYHNERKRWSALLKKYTTIVDLYTNRLIHCQFDYLDDALTKIEVLRIFAAPTSKCLHFGYSPIAGASKFVLFPVLPFIDDGLIAPPLKLFGGTGVRKVVSNVVASPEGGSYFAPLLPWHAYFMGGPPKGLEEVVYIFRPQTPWWVDDWLDFENPRGERPRENGDLFSARWQLLALDVLGQLVPDIVKLDEPIPFVTGSVPPGPVGIAAQLESKVTAEAETNDNEGEGTGGKEQAARTTCYLVDFPADVDLTKIPKIKDQLEENATTQHCFEILLRTFLLEMEESKPHQYKDQSTSLLERIKFLSLGEYDEILKPGELAVETDIRLF